MHEVEVLRPAGTATHPYLSPEQHPELLAEAVSLYWHCFVAPGAVGDIRAGVHSQNAFVPATGSGCHVRMLKVTMMCMQVVTVCLQCYMQGFPLQQRLLEYRCARYFYVDTSDSFLPVLDVPKSFNSQLAASAARLAAANDPRSAAPCVAC